MKYSSALQLNVIYVFRINDSAHKGCLKIGQTTSDDDNIWGLEANNSLLNEVAKKRINQYTQTAAIKYELLHTELTLFSEKGNIKSFNDSEVHRVLIRSGIEKVIFDTEKKANEWFRTDLETVKKAIKAVKEGRDSLGSKEISKDKNPIIFRPEQIVAIEKTKKVFQKSNKMLWNAKMRFGKTLAALQLVKDMNFSKTLILTHRPVVDAGWYDDFGKIFFDKPNFFYASKSKGESFQSLELQIKKKESKYIYFASMQDLRGSSKVGGNFNKNDKIFSTQWDLIIVDEAHEGTQTDKGENVMSELKTSKTKILELSGTPYKLFDNYQEEEIYTWDYVMEQKAKRDWDKIHFGDPNPYASLPKLNIYTYDLGKLINKFIDDELAFNFREFFRVDNEGKFVHEQDVIAFLNLMCKKDKESNYPYSNKENRNNFRHSLWMLPGVKEAKALSALLQSHIVFNDFKIVNVAGDGDEEEANEEALKKVKNAIGENAHQTQTITLSCGRLTTGVSVPAWTAVFMLSGSFNTSASTYMQTIFRVQTPATINGRVKEECFVFDFAPDRTLKVIAEVNKLSTKAKQSSESDKKRMGDFLNFCPVISIDGSKMIPYKVEGMLAQLKRVYIERVVQNGFEDAYLYNNDQLMKLNNVELKEFENLKGIIGSTKAMHKSSDIDVNNQGFTNEEYDSVEQAEKKNRSKKELSELEKKLLKEKEEKKKNRDSAVSILRGISIRMPLLIYGADIKLEDEDTQLTINNFSALIDDQSWLEFMPKGVSKKLFESFKKYYDEDIFRAAGKKIRELVRSADNQSIEERISKITSIFSTFRNPDKETVLTPWRVVNMHLGDCLGGYVFFDANMEKTLEIPRIVNNGHVTNNVFAVSSRILEINSKSGLYPLYMAYNIYRSRLMAEFPFGKSSLEDQIKVWDKTIQENIFVICKTPMAKSITNRTLRGFRKIKTNAEYIENLVNEITHNSENFVLKVKQGKSFWNNNKDNNMKFNAIVGNPPYQINVGVTKDNYGVLIFGKFVDISKVLKPDFVSMIIPSRWFTGGRGLEDFRKEMLNDKRLRYIKDFIDSKECFPGVDISGGIGYFLWDKNYEGECKFDSVSNGVTTTSFRKLNQFDIFLRYNRVLSIIEKVESKTTIFLDSTVGPQTPFGFVTTSRGSNKSFSNAISLFTSGGISFVSLSEVSKNKEWINKYKVIFSKATSEHAGTPDKQGMYRILSAIQILKPNEICSQTYLVGNIFDNQNSANNFVQYLKSRFVRIMILPTLTSQDLSKDKFQFVPLQDFSENSDIDWSKSIEEIDRQLYDKYELTQEERNFIEGMIKPM